MAIRDAIAGLRALAERKGFSVERGLMKDRWRLLDAKGVDALGPIGTPSFRLEEAKKFLSKQPDAE